MKPPLNYEDAASLQAHFKHLTDAEAEKLARLKTRPFGPESKEKFLRWYSTGFSIKDSLERSDLPWNRYTLTKALDKRFARNLKLIEKNRKKQVETTLFQYATGKLKVVKKTYQALLEKDGMPVLDVNGQQKFFCAKKEVTSLPAHPQLIQFYLKHNYPEMYAEQGADEDNPLSPDEIELKLEEAAKRLKIVRKVV